MAAKTERIKVEVTDSTEGETRTLKIVLLVPNGDFQLADLLRQRGVISSINGELKQAVKVLSKLEAPIEALTFHLLTDLNDDERRALVQFLNLLEKYGDGSKFGRMGRTIIEATNRNKT